ncbi:hypothetical protein SXANM310S_05689 [Streptomyces xanthochromogenes]
MNPILRAFVFIADQVLTNSDRALTTGLGEDVLTH